MARGDDDGDGVDGDDFDGAVMGVAPTLSSRYGRLSRRAGVHVASANIVRTNRTLTIT